MSEILDFFLFEANAMVLLKMKINDSLHFVALQVRICVSLLMKLIFKLPKLQKALGNLSSQ